MTILFGLGCFFFGFSLAYLLNVGRDLEVLKELTKRMENLEKPWLNEKN